MGDDLRGLECGERDQVSFPSDALNIGHLEGSVKQFGISVAYVGDK